jgi:hypothetical protein
MTVASPERKSAPAKAAVGADKNAPATQGLDLYERLLHPGMLRVGPCVMGIILGFIACCVAGATVAKANFYENFHRFTDYTSPTTLYYPTVSQMVSMVNLQSTPDQTIVIIGGNSIFNGVGQQSSEIWTDTLRQRLGSDYAVFNFATCGSQPFEGAYWVAESLLSKGRKVLYVTVAMPTAAGTPEGGKIYGYLYWDAHEKRFLSRSAERDALIERRIAMMDGREKERISELKLCMQLDRFLHFEDLWTAVAYTQAFTVWTKPTEASPFKARKLYPDLQPPLLPLCSRFSGSSTFAHELSMVRAYCDGFFEIKPIGWTLRQQAWDNLLTEMRGLVPDKFKKNCLVVVAGNPPYFLNRITADERDRVKVATAKSTEYWRVAGYNAVSAAKTTAASASTFEFNDEDFKDCWHLVGSGGKKMAALVAHEVTDLNRRIGYSEQGVNQ